jgi:hypothetical protein
MAWLIVTGAFEKSIGVPRCSLLPGAAEAAMVPVAITSRVPTTNPRFEFIQYSFRLLSSD